MTERVGMRKPTDAPMLVTLSAVRVFVSDLARALDFYTGPLRLQVSGTDGESWILFRLSNAMLLVEAVSADSSEYDALVGRFTGMSFDTEDIDGVHQRLSGLGVRFEGPPEKQHWGGVLAHFHDPDGNILTLVGR